MTIELSSMDSSALFIVGAQVRKMIEICRNNVDKSFENKLPSIVIITKRYVVGKVLNTKKPTESKLIKEERF